MSDTKKLRTEFKAAFDEASAIVTKAQDQGRDLTSHERAEVDRLSVKAESIADKIEKADSDAATTERLGSILAKLDGRSTERKNVVQDQPSPFATKIIRSLEGKTFGDANVILPRLDVQDLVPLGRDQASFAAQFPNPTIDEGQGTVSYVRESVRTNNVALVQPGAVKPTSVRTLDRKTHDVLHLATLTEPVETLMLRSENVTRFLDSELRFLLAQGLDKAIDTVLQNDVDVDELPFSTSAGESIRKGVTALQTGGYSADFVAVHPADAESIDLAATTLGYVWPTSPEGTVSKAWGLGVVVTAGITPGFAYVAERDALATFSGRLMIETDPGADGFEKNQVVIRAEVPTVIGVLRPGGVVRVDVAAA